MPESDTTLALRVQAHARAAGLRVPEVPDIIPVLKTAREAVARSIAGNKARCRELRSSFSLTVASGEVSLSTHLADPSRLLLEFLPHADVRDADGNRLYYLARDRYDMPQTASHLGYFTFEGQTFMARLADEEAGDSDFTAALKANYVPTSDEVPESCIPDVTLAVLAVLGPVEKKKQRKEPSE